MNDWQPDSGMVPPLWRSRDKLLHPLVSQLIAEWTLVVGKGFPAMHCDALADHILVNLQTRYTLAPRDLETVARNQAEAVTAERLDKLAGL